MDDFIEYLSEKAMPSRLRPHVLDDNSENYTPISKADIEQVRSLMSRGDRGAAYMLLAEKTGNMAFLNTAQISTGSGALLGGPAINANAQLQIAYEGIYPSISITEFSQAILERELQAFTQDVNENGDIFFIPPTELGSYVAADEAWLNVKGYADPQLQAIFPGRFFLATHYYMTGEPAKGSEYFNLGAMEVVFSAFINEVENSGVQFGISYRQAEIIAADGGSYEEKTIGGEKVKVFKDNQGKVVALFRPNDELYDSESSGIGLSSEPYTRENNPFLYSSTGGYVLGYLLAGVTNGEKLHQLLSIAGTASDENDARSYIDDIGGLLDAAYSPSRVGDLRDSFHKSIALAKDPVHAEKYTLYSLTDVSRTQIESAALDGSELGIAVRRGLLELTPYALVGANYSAYGQQLSVYDPATQLGDITESWVKDRTSFLYWHLADKSVPDGVQVINPLEDQGVQYHDLASGKSVLVLPNAIDIDTPIAPAVRRVIFGGKDADVLNGSVSDDRLYGGAGADVLIGGTGDDYLEGGEGIDQYKFFSGNGNDVLSDVDGELWIDEVRYTVAQRWAPDADSWHSEDGKVKFLRSGSDLLVLYGQGDSILIRNYVEGALGLRLEDTKATEDPSDAGLITGTPEDDYLSGTAGAELILGMGGNDLVNYHGSRGGNDTIVGGAGSDGLYGGEGDDRIYAYEIGEFGPPNVMGTGGGTVGDRLDGRDGNDLLMGSGGVDVLLGGAGSDTILGGDGGDLILADSTTELEQYTPDLQAYIFTFGDNQQFSILISSRPNNGSQGQAWNDVVFAGEGNDTVLGYSGNDYLEGNGGHDYMLAGEGNDTLVGGEGNDTLYGDGFDGVSETYPNSRLPGDMHGDDLLIGGDGHDLIVGNGGNDRLYGDKGNDTLFGDDRTAPAQYHGNDFLDGGTDNDVLLGMGGDDTLYGGEGNDWLAGEDHLSADMASSLTGKDWLYGGAGNDTLLGGNGDDHLDGGEGLDNLWGGEGNDTLNGGADADYLKDEGGENLFEGGSGDDTLEGGSGNDRYFFSKGDGVDFLTDREGVNSVIFGAGIERESLEFRQANSYDGNSYLTVDYEGGTINIENGMAGAISDFYFNDGSTLSLSTVLAEVGGLTLFAPDSGGQLHGSNARDILSGSLGNDLISAAGGNDHLYGNEGNDTLLGGAGDDNIAGGSGDDSLQGDAGNDTLAGGFGNDTLLGGSGDDVLSGGDGQDWLVGSEGNDTLSGGEGDDKLEGGAGIDTYLFSPGSGHDLIQDDEGEYSILRISSGVALTDLLSRREGNDLLIAYKDGSQSLRIEGYYSAAVNWEVADDNARHQSMDAFLAELSESSSIDVGFWERKFQLQVQAAFAAEQKGNGWELEGDGYFHSYSNGKTWERDSARRAVFKEFTMSGELSYGYDDSYYYEVAETSESRSEYVRTTKTVHSVSPGGLFSSGGGSSFVSAGNVQKLFSNQGGASSIRGSYSNVYSSTEPDKVVGIILDQSQGQGQGQASGLKSSVIEYTKYWSWSDTIYKVINGDDEDSYYRVDRGQIIRAGSGNDLMEASPYSFDTRTKGVYLSGGAGEDTLWGSYEADYLIGGAGNDFLMGGGGADTYILYSGDGVDIINDFPLPSYPDMRREGAYTYLETSEATALDKVVLPQEATLDNITLAWGQMLAEVNTGRPEWFQVEQNDGDEERFYDYISNFHSGYHRSLRVVVTLDISLGDGQLVRVVMPPSDSPQGSGIELYQFGDNSVLTQRQLLDHFAMGDIPDISTVGQVLRTSDVEMPGYALPLQGGMGNDTLYSGVGEDYLIGGNGDDLLYGSKGYDILDGGLGSDSYYIYSNGDGYSLDNITKIRDADGIGVIIIDDVKLDKSNLIAVETNRWRARDGVFSLQLEDESGDLIIQLPQGRVVVENYSPGKLGVNLPILNSQNVLAEIIAVAGAPWEYFVPIVPDSNGVLPELTALLDNDEELPQWLQFESSTGHISGAFEKAYQAEHVIFTATYPDGSIVQYELLLNSDWNYIDGTDDSDVLTGGKWADSIFAGNGEDSLFGEEGDDELYGGDGDDILDGGLGGDTLYGGQGNDVYVIDQIGDVVVEYPGEGIDKVISSVSWTLGDDVENLSLIGSAAIDGTGNALDNVLIGNGGDNVLRGRGGDDLLSGGLGNDTYVFGNGDGRDVINNLSVAAEAETDILIFDSISRGSLWFSRQGSNLVIDVMGAEDSVTIQDWYTSSRQQLDAIQAGSSSLYANQVDNLVNAMAAFGAPAGGEINLTQAQKEQLNVVIAANWQ
ncbi:hypothetical protein [Pseudomonas sp. PA27(2017)]|uniref:hypothetical protein n=1 Tax=Pseudomonas sp. PA27(2017) TaxID=1932112 RepID=UPI0021157F29|nr:hypothetical protein [Pseudomonas sp. PA27(2017)]